MRIAHASVHVIGCSRTSCWAVLAYSIYLLLLFARYSCGRWTTTKTITTTIHLHRLPRPGTASSDWHGRWRPPWSRR